MIKVAIIEDDPAILQMYRLKFEAEGFSVYTAENGEAGLLLCERQKPDIVLLDLMMPIISGDEMLAKLRETDWGKNMKVVVLTNVSEAKIAEKVKELGVIELLTKAQLTPASLVDKVRTLV